MVSNRIDWKWVAIVILCIASFVGFSQTSNNDSKIADNARQDAARAKQDAARTILIQRLNCMETNTKIQVFLHDFAAIATNPQAVQVLNDEAEKFNPDECK